MTLREKAEKLVLTYEEDFDLSSKEQRYTGLVLRIEQALREAEAIMRNKCTDKIRQLSGCNSAYEIGVRRVKID
mgnify:CR=1 FL=1